VFLSSDFTGVETNLQRRVSPPRQPPKFFFSFLVLRLSPRALPLTSPLRVRTSGFTAKLVSFWLVYRWSLLHPTPFFWGRRRKAHPFPPESGFPQLVFPFVHLFTSTLFFFSIFRGRSHQNVCPPWASFFFFSAGSFPLGRGFSSWATLPELFRRFVSKQNPFLPIQSFPLGFVFVMMIFDVGDCPRTQDCFFLISSPPLIFFHGCALFFSLRPHPIDVLDEEVSPSLPLRPSVFPPPLDVVWLVPPRFPGHSGFFFLPSSTRAPHAEAPVPRDFFFFFPPPLASPLLFLVFFSISCGNLDCFP